MKAALFEGVTPIMILKGSVKQLNANTSPTRVWREVAADVRTLADVPPLASLPVHAEFEQRGE